MATGNGQRATGNGQRATGNGQRAARIPNPAQDFLLCVARSASVYSVVQKIKTLFTTEVTEFTEVEIKDKDFRF